MARNLSYINTSSRTGQQPENVSAAQQSYRPSYQTAAGASMAEVLKRLLPIIAENYVDAITQLMPESCLFNPAFANGAQGWQVSDKEKAYIAESDGKNRLILLEGGSIQQSNALIRKPSKHKEYAYTEDRPEKDISDESYTPSSELVTDTVTWPELDKPVKKEGEEEKNGTLALGLSFICRESGTIHVGFAGSDDTDKDALKFQDVQIQESQEPQTISAQGTWDGLGDFRIYLSQGQVEICSLSLTDMPIADFRKEADTRFRQAEENIQIILETANAELQRIKLIQGHINQLYTNDSLFKEKQEEHHKSIENLKEEDKTIKKQIADLRTELDERITAANTRANEAYSYASNIDIKVDGLSQSLENLAARVKKLEES